MDFEAYKVSVLSHLNELALAHRNATATTWPALRDEVLKSQDMLEELNHLGF